MDILFWVIFVILIGFGLYKFSDVYYRYAIERADHEMTLGDHIREIADAYTNILVEFEKQFQPILEQLAKLTAKSMKEFERAMK